ncbi:unnamed protein product [Paramecium pentaurelia]|uniref:Uncharacterized protein n=1 Tax=Paramecium pentaurelia TaxID=43138 RepID=A0A8S1XXX3_9CILI|nr:unnamed protein product [Paramecium pentaurelia]
MMFNDNNIDYTKKSSDWKPSSNKLNNLINLECETQITAKKHYNLNYTILNKRNSRQKQEWKGWKNQLIQYINQISCNKQE